MIPSFLIVDLFCGAGGTTLGFVTAANGIAKVIACVNHDHKAIESHWKNHPEVKHFEEDIRTLDLIELINVVRFQRSLYPNAKLILWASLECTNFSKAKGGMAREADSRTLACHLPRYITAINPDYIQIENVVEFMSWGPLNEKGRPVSTKNGQDWLKWRESICNLGYQDDWKQLNSADFGAYTSRNRLFGIFAAPGMPIVWPEPTHAKNPKKGSGMFKDLKKWMAVKDVLNFTDEGESIFNRKKPLVDNTLKRILAGLIKFVAKGDKAFLSKYFSGKPSGKVVSINGPAGTLTTVCNQAVVQPIAMLKYNSTDKNGKHTPPSINEPSPVVAAQSRLGIISGVFLSGHYSTGDNVTSVDSPCPTLSTKDRFQFVQPEYFIDKHFGKTSQNQSINSPAGTLLPNDKHRLVETVPMIMRTGYSNKPTSVDDPAPTLQASRRHHYLVFNKSYGGHCHDTEEPSPVIIARQDKAPLFCLQMEVAPVMIPVYDTDSETMINIKKFMAAYGLADIRMRMLRVIELLRIQGFPPDYFLAGNQSDQKKFIGNSVVPLVVKVWTEALFERNNENKNAKVA